ncbi:hypothetical protein B0T24DRAFT_596516 [Lasiosphaeria ovina]|uniref:Uncharacterized protein n=1 Tax=Lasiosphaeria ovina TaxID=92902 RepID=A0AAE0JYB7_9PEZI|nr:hypothetical protein B0T24DRAFT_596516 [Lasiosphaeria ovina]
MTTWLVEQEQGLLGKVWYDVAPNVCRSVFWSRSRSYPEAAPSARWYTNISTPSQLFRCTYHSISGRLSGCSVKLELMRPRLMNLNICYALRGLGADDSESDESDSRLSEGEGDEFIQQFSDQEEEPMPGYRVRLTYEYARSEEPQDIFLRAFFQAMSLLIDSEDDADLENNEEDLCSALSQFADYLVDDFFLPLRAIRQDAATLAANT